MFYVTIVRGRRTGVLGGPFDSPEAARPWVEPAREMAEKLDPRAEFDAFGVCRIRGRSTPGPHNKWLGYTPDPEMVEAYLALAATYGGEQHMPAVAEDGQLPVTRAGAR